MTADRSLLHRLRAIRITLDGIDLVILGCAALQAVLFVLDVALSSALIAPGAMQHGGSSILFSGFASLLFCALVFGLWGGPLLIWRRLIGANDRQRLRKALVLVAWIVAIASLPKVLKVWIVSGTPGWPVGAGGVLTAAIALAALHLGLEARKRTLS